jgi:hypothetical protein
MAPRSRCHVFHRVFPSKMLTIAKAGRAMRIDSGLDAE